MSGGSPTYQPYPVQSPADFQNQMQSEADKAADAVRKRAAAASGRAATILTPMSNSLAAPPTGKTLLGS